MLCTKRTNLKPREHTYECKVVVRPLRTVFVDASAEKIANVLERGGETHFVRAERIEAESESDSSINLPRDWGKRCISQRECRWLIEQSIGDLDEQS